MNTDDDWPSKDNLPKNIKCVVSNYFLILVKLFYIHFYIYLLKVQGMKTIAKWVLGLNDDVLDKLEISRRMFQTFNVFMEQNSRKIQFENLSKYDLAWLRLQAGCCMLKICEQRGVGDQYTNTQFILLSTLMTVYFNINI